MLCICAANRGLGLSCSGEFPGCSGRQLSLPGTNDEASAAMVMAGGALIMSAPVEVQENRAAED